MATFDCSSEITSFHQDEVTLRKPEQDEMRSRRDAGRTRLVSGLSEEGYPLPKMTVSQGSYAMRTMVEDDDCDYDIDDGAYFAKEDLVDENGAELTPLQAKQRVCDALSWDKRLNHKAKVKRNCVRQMYPDGYHIDVPVYRIIKQASKAEGSSDAYELASGDQWMESDARTVTSWYRDRVGELNELQSGESDGSQMRRVTRMTKKMAKSRKSWKSETTSGICLTKLVVDHFVACAGRDDESLRDTWDAINIRLSGSTMIEHPVVQGQNLAENGDNEVQFFKDCLCDALKYLEVLEKTDCSPEQARKAWDCVFNTDYFSNSPSPKEEQKTAASVSIISQETARRDDGGNGRFG